MAGAVVLQVHVGHDEPCLGEPQVTHPGRPGFVEGVHEVLGAGEVRAAQRRGRGHVAPAPVRAHVRHVDGGQPGQAGRDAVAGLGVEGFGDPRGFGVLGERYGGAELVTAAFVDAVQDHAGLVPFEVPHDDVAVLAEDAPERDRGELAPRPLRYCGVGVDCGQPRAVVDVLVPDDAELGGLVVPAVAADFVDPPVARAVDLEPVGGHERRDGADAVEHAVVGQRRGEAVAV
ncbi:MAG: hypothetical protein ACRDQ7_13125, partial [Haloechinothrix sp.]